MIVGIYKGQAVFDTPEEMVITLFTNQPELSADGAVITIRSTEGTETLTWDGTPIIRQALANINYKITFSALPSLRTPDPITFTTQASNRRIIDAIYKAEKITINVRAEDDLPVNQQTISITDISTNQVIYSSLVSELTEVFLPFDTHYSITGDDYITEDPELRMKPPTVIERVASEPNFEAIIEYLIYHSPIIINSIEGAWIPRADGSRKSNTITHNQITKETINFTSIVPNTQIIIHMCASSEGADYAMVGHLNSTAMTGRNNYTGYVAGTDQTAIDGKDISVAVPTVGDHFVQVGYAKDSSVNTGLDAGWYWIVEQEIE